MDKFRKIVFTIDDKIGMAANITLAGNMMVVVVSVVGRVIFHHPIGGLVDMVSFIFLLSCVLSICYAEKEKAHVKMDLLMQRLPRRGKIVLHTILGAITLALLAIIPYLFFQYAKSTFAAHNASLTIQIPYFPFVVVALVCFLFFLITFLINFINAYDNWRTEK